MKELLLEYMDSINAEGIDFVALSFPLKDIVYKSYTRDEFEKCGVVFKTNRVMWRIINGEKHYYCGKNDSGYVMWKDLEGYRKEFAK